MKMTSQTVRVEFGDMAAWIRLDGEGMPEHVEHCAIITPTEREVLAEIPAGTIARLAAVLHELEITAHRGYSSLVRPVCPDHGYHDGGVCRACHPPVTDDKTVHPALVQP